ncbi:MAG: hypothetical protein LUD48_05950 [Prevotella sp.]|nr:hypothetical protein [Prevotella sp.]
MKKILLGAFALIAAMTVNAQEIGFADSQEFSDAYDLGGVVETRCVLHDGDNVTWLAGGSDTWDYGGSSFRFYINDETDNIQKSNGAKGSANPGMSTTDGGVAQGAPTSGAYHIFDVKTDGYLYVLAKLNTNKNYVAIEEGDRIPYYWAAYKDGEGVISYNLMDQTDMLDYNADLDEYFIKDDVTVQKPNYYIYGPEGDTGSGVDCTMGVVKFQVWAGCEYIFCGTGTKVAVGGYYFDTTGDTKITYVEVSDEDTSVITAEHVLCDENSVVGSGSAGISNITVAPTTENGAIYNLAGQRVSSANKGIFVVNGKKILVK